MKTYFVDSFTNEPFKGNPAAVCMAERALDNKIMQSIAMEIGFSETAFITALSETEYRIRFFTPKMEIPLCGHATLAAAKIIFDSGTVPEIRFLNCENVELKIKRSGSQVVMAFPVYDTIVTEVPCKMLDALGIGAVVETRYSPKNKIIVVEIASSDALASLQPDFGRLTDSYSGINGVLVTAVSSNVAFDFQYRYFWPWAGTNEDPVTGGVQTFLTKYWATRLNKTRLRAFQSSLRTGTMVTEFLEDKVLIYGEAVTVFEGEIKI